MQVNTSVKVIDDKSEHFGRAGVVQKAGKLLSVELDADNEREKVVAEFRPGQLQGL